MHNRPIRFFPKEFPRKTPYRSFLYSQQFFRNVVIILLNGSFCANGKKTKMGFKFFFAKKI